jgi:hypothetical protein
VNAGNIIASTRAQALEAPEGHPLETLRQEVKLRQFGFFNQCHVFLIVSKIINRTPHAPKISTGGVT